MDGRHEAQKYVIEQLKINGFDSYFASNTPLKSGLEKIKADIEKSKSSMATSNPGNTDDVTTIILQILKVFWKNYTLNCQKYLTI